jgi:hypothetical protein
MSYDAATCFLCTGEYKGYMREVAELDESFVYFGKEQICGPLLRCAEKP